MASNYKGLKMHLFINYPLFILMLFAHFGGGQKKKEDELDETVQVWNSHIIRPSKNDKVPSGRPNIMYLMPELYGTENFVSPIDKADLQLCKRACIFRSTVPYDPDVYKRCYITMAELQLAFPKETYEALDLYIQLRNGIRASL